MLMKSLSVIILVLVYEKMWTMQVNTGFEDLGDAATTLHAQEDFSQLWWKYIP